MIVEITLAILVGCFLGIISGLTPGIHINLISVTILAASPFLLQYTSPIVLILAIIAMSITHTFLDFLPSCFLGAPDPETVLTVLPGHRLLQEGKGYEAVRLSTVGSISGLILVIILAPILIFLTRNYYDSIKIAIPYLLIICAAFLILRESNSKLWALILFLLSGVLGIATLNSTVSQPLFPLFSGLFGISTLIVSLKDNNTIPLQTITKPIIKFRQMVKALSSGFLASIFCGTLPGLGVAQASILATTVSKKWTPQTFLILNGAVNTMVMFTSVITLYTIGKARSGEIVIMQKLIAEITFQTFIMIVITAITAGIIATMLALKIAKIFSRLITKISYKKLCISIILLITALVALLTGLQGLFILIVSTFVGMLPPLVGIGRNHLMGSLIVPVLLFFLL